MKCVQAPSESMPWPLHFLCDLASPDCSLSSCWPPLFLHDYRHSSKCWALPASSPSVSASNSLPVCSQFTHHICMEAFLQYSTKELSQLFFLPLPCSISFLAFNRYLSCFFIALHVLPSLSWKCKSLLCGAGYYFQEESGAGTEWVAQPPFDRHV